MTFTNRFVSALPRDPSTAPWSRQVHGAAWSSVAPTPVPKPTLLAQSSEVADLLGIVLDETWVEVLGGNKLLPGMEPYAAAYGGHQFGHWAGQLGDGRAITLGEWCAPDNGRWELQLKGAGPTPYARHADGRAVLRSSIREFLASEAMFHLGVPTTRALSLVATGDLVLRDELYDGHPRDEPGAIVCRVAPSFMRFGTFELPASRGDGQLLRALVTHALDTHFPELDTPIELLREVGRRTIALVTHWQRVGFVHGVLNTDNMSLLGLTLDFGPFGWLEPYAPSWTPNTTDGEQRRYAFGNQTSVILWNLARLAEALLPVVREVAPLQAALDDLVRQLGDEMRGMWRAKLGLDDDDQELVQDLQQLMADGMLDYTDTFRRLSAGLELTGASYGPLPDDFARRAEAWIVRWEAHHPDRTSMDRVNPRYVLRNYLAYDAIVRAESGDATGILALQDVLRHPYETQPGCDAFAALRPDWAVDRAGCSMLSCSS